MAYTDYSSHWSLDTFLTYLEANILGSNDEHLYDSFAVEHNINTATIDGTHKANSILGSYINTTPISTGQTDFTVFVYSWTPAVGVYQIVNPANQNLYLEIYVSGVWRTPYPPKDFSGIAFFDGTNMRITGVSANYSFYYQKF